MAPPTNIGASGAIGFDEALNWQHNNPVQEQDPSRRKSLFRKVGITTQRKRANAEDDLPPFVMRQIPYDTWRKHYAKDKDGNYKGTHAPAEDCLLKPEDVQKWRLGDAVTKADQWTRGKEALPVYSEVHAEGAVPEYSIDIQDSSHSAATNETILTPEEGRLAEYFDVTETEVQRQLPPSSGPAPQSFAAANASQEGAMRTSAADVLADGKTAEEIIEEAKAKGKQKLTWKQKLSKAFETAMASATAVS
jgi:hypothetical protein